MADQQPSAEDIKKAKAKAKAEEKAAKAAKAKAKADARKKEEEEKKKNSTGAAEPKQKTIRLKQEFVNKTPAGEKKNMSEPMAAAYDPPAVEAAWYDWWSKQGFFSPDVNKDSEEKFVIVIPPPNVTGSLHLGHALTNSIQDALVRWNRMKGVRALWVPGTDHAGIATQVVVEKRLYKERGLTRRDLGREDFIKEVWKWKQEYGDRITSQLRRIGSSLDWSRETFTMDEVRSRAVNEAFVRLYEKGMIYRDTRIVNWCCKLNTAISDIEVDTIELNEPTFLSVPNHDGQYQFGVLVHFAYKVADSDDEIIIATTRVETMLGDTAIAINSKDERYKHLHGKHVVHPFCNRNIPIITDDELVDMSFGTGAVKVTPAHDPNDFKCGKRNNLQFITIFNDDGTINENGGEFKGMKRYDARNAVLEKLKEKGLYRETKPNPMVLGVCSRSKDIIEPMIKPQWWVSCKEVAARSVKAVKDGELEIIPTWHKDTWYRWLENIQDWCISRQLWWGHRIPAYLVKIAGKDTNVNDPNSWVVARTREEALAAAAAKFGVDASTIQLEQDEDVLDTWFSSGLFPFSVFGWPDETEDFKTFYPTSCLETGHDILFFWVARMVMMGLSLTDKLPFTRVLLHAMVRDAHGRKMSKTLGNVIDPIDVIEGITLAQLQETLLKGNLDPKEIEKAKEGQATDYPNGISECGTDAMRFALCAYTSQGKNINLDVNRVAAYRNFCNKLWNATKFAMMTLGENFKPNATPDLTGSESPIDKWILNKLNVAIKETNQGLADFEFAQSTSAIYNFWLYQLCDVYLEAIKPVTKADVSDPANAAKKRAAQDTLFTCLEYGLKLIHPFMPYVSEELYQRLPRREGDNTPSICVARYPTTVAAWSNPEIESEIKLVQDAVHAARSLRADYNLTAKQRVSVYIRAHKSELVDIFERHKGIFLSLSLASDVTVGAGEAPEGCAVNILNEHVEVYLVVKGIVDIKAEIQKMEAKKKKLEGDLENWKKKLNAPNYETKVPENVRKLNAEKITALTQEIQTTINAIENFKKFSS
eukprot:TRINITY_DN379_c0_g1_i2.p1 TRINITY_DN379_c0_g1~~TRINITY_DN379_c0_g1_i2.p1  ORF type:complete len:1044 (-),score=309.33 TRINITY_DN379_c0_g1_i2:162-3293(-)